MRTLSLSCFSCGEDSIKESVEIFWLQGSLLTKLPDGYDL